ncbi:hypothetical protein [Peribacillus alkalitolerans]|uniref:hypothetical protein n=1 Tax=Peribacillus alkalitolerans TaxID=1550385 RepID=UPI0013D09C55|nr:hypothetical protein [Peribacillus alkalitolerans]
MIEFLEWQELGPYLFVASIFIKTTATIGLFYFLVEYVNAKNRPFKISTHAEDDEKAVGISILILPRQSILQWFALLARNKESVDDEHSMNLFEINLRSTFQGGLSWIKKQRKQDIYYFS